MAARESHAGRESVGGSSQDDATRPVPPIGSLGRNDGGLASCGNRRRMRLVHDASNEEHTRPSVMNTPDRRPLSLIVMAVLATACAGTSSSTGGTPAASNSDGPRIVQPGAPGQSSRTIAASDLAEAEGVSYSAADVHFMQGMISHHAQALEMTAMVRQHATTNAVQRMGLRMEISQRDEIGLMQTWLADHGESGGVDHDMGSGLPMMPGMLTPAQMEQLGAARGAQFDRLFLELMIQHHEGAIVMVGELFNTSGAGQESLIFKFASDVDADQTMEIERMQGLLNQGR